jgi:hypothetical protein
MEFSMQKIFALVVISTVITIASSIAMASGFRCEGQGYSVKLYNEVQPSLGTKNPAVLVVSSPEMGTIIRLQGSEIEKLQSVNAVAYQGNTRDVNTGRFASVRIEIVKQPVASGDYAGQHFARLQIKSDNGTWTAKLACSEYLKGAN